MKRILRAARAFLRTARFHVNLLGDYLYDYRRYARHSATSTRTRTYDWLVSRIIANTHVIEKGLSLPQPRPGFGKAVLGELFLLVEKFQRHGHDTHDPAYLAALETLQAYLDFHHRSGNGAAVTDLEARLAALSMHGTREEPLGGTRTMSKKEIIDFTRSDYAAFAGCRYSVRRFAKEPVDVDRVKEAIRLAQRAPSACNRQSARVYVVRDKNRIEGALNAGRGSRGFSEGIRVLLVVASDMVCFGGPHERNQAFIDGGIFLMSLLHSLHYHGLAACTLNWSYSSGTDRRLRKVIPLRASETVVALVAVGNYEDEVVVPISCRLDSNKMTRCL